MHLPAYNMENQGGTTISGFFLVLYKENVLFFQKGLIRFLGPYFKKLKNNAINEHR
jgi:hypothetical protein